jgi:hypothetical protein
MCEELLDATDFGQDPSDKRDSVEMPESFGYLSECDPNFQGVLKFVMNGQLQEKRSVPKNGSKKNKDKEEESAMARVRPLPLVLQNTGGKRVGNPLGSHALDLASPRIVFPLLPLLRLLERVQPNRKHLHQALFPQSKSPLFD